MSARMIVLWVDDTDTATDLSNALRYAIDPPWIPLPPGANHRTTPQERWGQEETDMLLLTLLKRAAPKVRWGTDLIVPESRENSDGND